MYKQIVYDIIKVEDNMEIRIEKYKREDFSQLVKVIEFVLDEYGFEFGVGDLKKDLTALSEENAYRDAKEGFWIAKDGENVIGSVAIRAREDDLAELKRFYLLPVYRGLGIGSRLYEVAEEFAIKNGYEGIWLESSRRFKLASKLYLKKGFRLLEELDNDWEDNIYEKVFRKD